MNDDLTTPPDQPLDDAARARLRGRVLAGLDESATPGSRRPWAVPVAAAAAVVALAGATGYATLRPGPDDDVAPAGRSTAAVNPTPTPPPTDDLTVPDAPGASEPPDAPDGVPPTEEGPAVEPTPSDGGVGGGPAGACRRDLRDVLPGAVPALAVEGTLGTTSYLVQGDRYVLCDTAGGIVTLHGAQPIDARYSPDDTTPWRVSTNAVDPRDGAASGYDLVFVAGGIVASPARRWATSYTFPDGHVEEATTSTDAEGRTWWRMEYVATDGVLVAPGTDQTSLDPIVVDVQVAGTSTEHELRWAEDTCAQVNHGC